SPIWHRLKQEQAASHRRHSSLGPPGPAVPIASNSSVRLPVSVTTRVVGIRPVSRDHRGADFARRVVAHGETVIVASVVGLVGALAGSKKEYPYDRKAGSKGH